MSVNLKRQDYQNYRWRRRELLIEVIKGSCLVVFLACFFFRSIWAVVPLSPVGFVYLKRRKKERGKQCRHQLVLQFKECILSVSASLKAGYAVENAFVESGHDMKMLYGENSFIYREIETIRRGLVLNITMEEMLADLAERSGREEMIEFAEVFTIAKRGGGSIPEIIQSSAELIGQKIESQEQIRTLLAARKLEQRIMNVMPFGILIYIGVTYPGYFDMLYHNLFGVLVMAGCLAVYLTAYCLAQNILNRTAEGEEGCT